MDHSVTNYWSGLFTYNSIPLAFGSNNPQLDTFMAVDSLSLLHAFGNLPLGDDSVVPMMSMAFTDPRTCKWKTVHRTITELYLLSLGLKHITVDS